jgi:hypothetical protein
MSEECILSILKKDFAKPPAHRGCSAYASESDSILRHSSIVIRHSTNFTQVAIALPTPPLVRNSATHTTQSRNLHPVTPSPVDILRPE